MAWLKYEDNPELDDDDEDLDKTWDVAQPEVALKLYFLLEQLDWKFPPSVLLKEDDCLMRDLGIIAWRKRKLSEIYENKINSSSPYTVRMRK